MLKPTANSEPPSDTEEGSLTDLAAGQLSLWTRWNLRREIARSADRQHELAETQALFAALRTLQAESVERPAPTWQSPTPDNRIQQTSSRHWQIGSLVMNRRLVIAATASLVLLCITGGYAAVRYFSTPFDHLDAGNGMVWRAEHRFRGQVRFYSADGTSQGSFGRDGAAGEPITALVIVNQERFTVTGEGRHPLRSASGTLLGTVELLPETPAEREQWRQKHDQENGIEQQLHMSYGSKGGYGQAIGYFGAEPDRITWKLSGSNVRVRFFDARTGRQVYSAKAGAVNDAIRAQKKQTLSPESFAETVALKVPSEPRFSWRTPDGKEHAFQSFRSYPLTLADGTELRVELEAVPSH